jgi:ArsR family transcriptional regulator, arsenate/arsenite/antimonite-responsive transcriptional repressor
VARMKIHEERQPAVVCCAPIAATKLTDEEAEATAGLFKALADPARIRLLNALLSADRAVCVCDLTPATGLSQPTVSHHLRKLMDAGLISREERGTWAYYSADEEAMRRLGYVADVRKGARWPI